MMAGKRFWLMIAVLLTATVCLHLVWHGEAVALAKPLASFPTVLGALQSHDSPLENWEVQAVQVDDYLSRVYRGSSGLTLYLYIGYYKSQRAGQTVHTPTNCLPGSGWQVVTASYLNLSLPNGEQGTLNSIVVGKGLDQQVVLYWYQAHGRVIANEYRAKFYTIWDAIKMNRTDATLVRVVTPILDDESKARESAVAFAKQTLVQLDELIPR